MTPCSAKSLAKLFNLSLLMMVVPTGWRSSTICRLISKEGRQIVRKQMQASQSDFIHQQGHGVCDEKLRNGSIAPHCYPVRCTARLCLRNAPTWLNSSSISNSLWICVSRSMLYSWKLWSGFVPYPHTVPSWLVLIMPTPFPQIPATVSFRQQYARSVTKQGSALCWWR